MSRLPPSSSSTSASSQDSNEVIDVGQDTVNGSTAKSAGTAKGMSRLPFVRKIVEKLIESTKVRVTGLEVRRPDQTRGLNAHIKLRIRDVAKGPVALSATVKFQGVSELCWPAKANEGQDGKQSKKVVLAGPVIARATLEPMRLHATAPGVNYGETDISLIPGNDDEARKLGQLVRAVLRSSSQDGITLVFRAQGLTVKALGFTFKGLTLEKEIRIGGLDELGGLLRLPAPGPDGLDYLSLDITRPRSDTRTSDTPSESSKRKFGFLKKKSFRQKNGPDETLPLQQHQGASSNDSPPAIPVQNLQVTGGDAQNGIQVTAFVDVKLPTSQNNLPDFSIQLGVLKLDLFAVVERTQELVKVGHVTTTENSVISLGDTRLYVEGYIKMPSRLPVDSPQRAAAANLLSSFLQNESVSIIAIAGERTPFDEGASKAAWLTYGITGSRLNGFLAPLGDKARLLDGAQLRAQDDTSSKSSSKDSAYEPKSPTSKNSANGSSGLSPRSGPSENLLIRATIHNSFGTDVAVTKLRVKAVDDADYSTLLGTVETPPGWSGLKISAGESVPVNLPFSLNPDPAAMVKLLRSAAKKDGIVLDESFSRLLSLLNNETSLEEEQKTSNPADAGSLDFAEILSHALANLKVTAFVGLDQLSIGGYVLPGGLDYAQKDLSVSVPTTAATLLIPQVERPWCTSESSQDPLLSAQSTFQFLTRVDCLELSTSN
ncbi:unnamed protein product [Sympodiomycopsis kandeliae]